jgi:hypothetical protein
MGDPLLIADPNANEMLNPAKEYGNFSDGITAMSGPP